MRYAGDFLFVPTEVLSTVLQGHEAEYQRIPTHSNHCVRQHLRIPAKHLEASNIFDMALIVEQIILYFV